MSRTPADLDPADAEVRGELRRILLDIRDRAGIRQAALARRMGIEPAAASRMEQHTGRQISTLQRWTLALSHRLILRPEGVPYVDVSILRPADEAEAMEWDRQALRDAMTDARRELGLSAESLAEVMGVTGNAVRAVEVEALAWAT